MKKIIENINSAKTTKKLDEIAAEVLSKEDINAHQSISLIERKKFYIILIKANA